MRWCCAIAAVVLGMANALELSSDALSLEGSLLGTEEHFGGDANGDESFLEVATATQGHTRCNFLGDTHLYSDWSGTPKRRWYNVMGEGEWIIARSKATSNDGTPYFEMQITQVPWQRSGCREIRPHITIAKDVAFKCGNTYFLWESPRTTSGGQNCNENQRLAPNIDYSRFFAKGVFGGKTYDWEMYSPTFKQSVSFGEGSVYINHLNCQSGCKKGTLRSSPTNFDFYCGSVSTGIRANVYPSSGPATYTNANVYLPTSGDAGQVVRDSQLATGVCGGWADNTIKTAMDTCLQNSNVAPTWVYPAATGGGMPGTGGTQDDRRQNTAHFYTTNDCKTPFIPTDRTSIFRMFEVNTKGKANAYDSIRWSSTGSSEQFNDKQEEDGTAMAKAKTTCSTVRKGYDNRDDSQLNLGLTRDNILKIVTEQCVEDVYFQVDWTAETFKTQMCTNVQSQVDYERMDMKCAHDAYKSIKFSDASISSIGPGKTTAEKDIMAKHDAVADLQLEISNSQQNIDYWDTGVCDIANTDFAKAELDCSKHKFMDTTVTGG